MNIPQLFNKARVAENKHGRLHAIATIQTWECADCGHEEKRTTL